MHGTPLLDLFIEINKTFFIQSPCLGFSFFY
jgi:hypothetical protein